MKVRLKHQQLARELEKRNLSLNHWGLKMGLSKGHLSLLVNGKRPYPSPSTRRKLLRGLETDFHVLFEVENDEKSNSGGAGMSSSFRTRLSPQGPRGASTMESIRQDIRTAFRSLVRHPSFALTALLTLALGIGANTAIFSAVSAVLINPLPYRQPGRLVAVWNLLASTGPGFSHLSGPEYVDLSRRNQSLESLAAGTLDYQSLTGRGDPLRLGAAYVSGNFFSTLGVEALHGRTLQPADLAPEAPPAALLSHGLWSSVFAASAEVVGQTIQLDGRAYEVVGVLPARFSVRNPDIPLLQPQDVYLPFPFPFERLERDSRFLLAIGRLKSGVTPAAAQSDMDGVANQLAVDFIEDYHDKGYGIAVEPLDEQIAGQSRFSLLALQGAVGFLLLLVCVNLATLQLARAAARRSEVAIRMALGAGRLRLARQFLAEALLLALPGGIAAIGLAHLGVDAIRRLGPSSIPRLDELAIDTRVLLFAAAVSLAAALVFGLAPLLQISLKRLARNLAGDARSGGRRRGEMRLRQGLVAAQVALALMLTVGCGLMLRSLLHLQAVDSGFQGRDVLTLAISLPSAKYPERRQQVAFFERLEQAFAAVPGVDSVGAVSRLPFSHTNMSGGVTIEDPASEPGPVKYELARRHATPGYFAAMGIELVEGRLFDSRDQSDSAPVALIDDRLAQRLWPGQSVLGRRLHRGGLQTERPWRTIVGVVRHVKHRGLDVEGREQVYFPLTQQPDDTGFMFITVRSPLSASALTPSLRQALRTLDPDLPLSQLASMQERVASSLAQPRFYSLLLAMFALLGLCLGSMGVYSVIAYMVHRRTREIGLRMALGARTDEVFRMVVRRALALAVVGIAAGTAASLALGGYLSTLLFQVVPTDPLTLAASALILLLIALAAAAFPARRAASLNPTCALRVD
ncbi:MAG TPA: ADOP family duplicated permease [Acidobacteriota bacterium]|nr:ADOP family duplicated permease [Acidobacteriota bacterium]